MTLLQASFEVAPSGAAIPKSGGTDAFTAGETGSGAAFVSDSSVPAAIASGTLAAKVSVGSSAVYNYRQWLWSSPVVHVRQYIYLTAAPNTRFTWWQNDSTGYALSKIRINTDLRIGVATPSTVWWTSAAIPLNTLVRVEASFDHSAGSMSLAMYLANSTVAISGGTVSTSGVSFPETTVLRLYGGVLSTLTNYTVRTDAWAVSDVAQQGPIVTGAIIPGVTATVAVSSSAGSVQAVVGETVVIAGVTPQVLVQGGERKVPPVPADLGLWPPDPYRSAIRSGGYDLTYWVDATLNGAPVVSDLRPIGGSITDTTKPGVRRVLNVELAPRDAGLTQQELFDALAPYGTQLKVWCRITYLNKRSFDISMGVFDVDSEKLAEGDGALSLTAPDKWSRIQRAQFVKPVASRPGILVVDQIAILLQDVLGSSETVAVSATSTAVMGWQVWERDREKAIIELAESIGAWVYFDRDGAAVIADVPTIGISADWLIDAAPQGVLIELDRERSRGETKNVMVVESSASDGERFPLQYVWDDDPDSPTYAGTDPLLAPETAGPFGIVTDYYETAANLTADEARLAGMRMLARVSGLASQISLSGVPNPAMDAFDVIDVLPPGDQWSGSRILERHVADTVTHPLGVEQPQHVDGRSTRTSALVGGL